MLSHGSAHGTIRHWSIEDEKGRACLSNDRTLARAPSFPLCFGCTRTLEVPETPNCCQRQEAHTVGGATEALPCCSQPVGDYSDSRFPLCRSIHPFSYSSLGQAENARPQTVLGASCQVRIPKRTECCNEKKRE